MGSSRFACDQHPRRAGEKNTATLSFAGPGDHTINRVCGARVIAAAAGTELNSSPHCRPVSERRAEDTPMTIRPDGTRAPGRLYFGPDVNESWLIFGLVAVVSRPSPSS